MAQRRDFQVEDWRLCTQQQSQVWEVNCEIHCLQRRTDLPKRAPGCYVENWPALEHHAGCNTPTRQLGKVCEGEVLIRRAKTAKACALSNIIHDILSLDREVEHRA